MPRVVTIKQAPSFPPGNYFGVDPGVNGGLAVIVVRDGYPDVVKAVPVPEDKTAIYHWFLYNKATQPQFVNVVILEKVGGFIASTWGAGKKNMIAGHTAFTFGKMTGWVDMAITCAGFKSDEVFEVIPRVWQAGCSIPPRKSEKDGRKVNWLETTSQFKNRLKTEAERIFTTTKITLKVSDALLMAHYGRLVRRAKDEGHDTRTVGTTLRNVEKRVRK